jgi:hypothetical protein
MQRKFGKKKKEDNQEKAKPTHFDLEPFLKAFKEFVTCNSEFRSHVRMEVKNESDTVDSVFVDEYGERSFKKCVNIMELEKLLAPRNVTFHQGSAGSVGRMLR